MAPTTAKLKHDIDRGRGGDKVNVIDPAATPLGTDDEAAGMPPSPAAVKTAHRDEILSNPASSERYDRDHGVAIYIGVIATLVVSVGLALWLTS
jgi:hypothetical protein